MLVALDRKNKIAELLKAKQMSIYRLAKESNLNYKTTHNLVKSDTISPDTRYGTLLQVAITLGVSIDELEQ